MRWFCPLVCSRAGRFGKQSAILLLPALWLAFCLPAAAQTAGQVVTSHAARIDFRHTGIHTHANYLLFDTGAYDVAAMQRDPVRYPHLTVRAHSALPTDRAALPPDLAAFSQPGDPPLDNPYGPIDGGKGKPGWTVVPLHQNGRNYIKVTASTRFANWLALQPRPRQKQYQMPGQYTLIIRWGRTEKS